MTNRRLLGAGVALAVALGGVQAHAQLFPWNQPGVPGAWYIGPEGGWPKPPPVASAAASEGYMIFFPLGRPWAR